jgi:ABC-type polysaccharide/polyol phosphate transport system ATPase subunit
MPLRAPHVHLHHTELPDDVLLRVEGLSKAAPQPGYNAPRWVSRVLPGVQWSATGQRQEDIEDEEEDELDDELGEKGREGALQEMTFDLAPGEGLGLIGNERAGKTLFTLLAGIYPPSTGRVLVRGRIAPVFRYSELNFAREDTKRSIKVVSRFLGWPPDFLGSRWNEIVDFAHQEEVVDMGFVPGSIEYDAAWTKRLMLSALMHLDATVYTVVKAFAGTDLAMYERCCDVLEQRQREGCAILQVDQRLPALARFCHEAIVFEEGAPVFRGRLGDVAKFMAERREEKKKRERVWRVPVRALLASDRGGLSFGPDGGTIPIELDVFKPLEFDIGIRFTDATGRELQIEQPDPFLAEQPGVYRVAIGVPGGLLGEGSLQATFLALRRVGDEDIERSVQELLTFEIGSENGDGATVAEPLPAFNVLSEDDQLEPDLRDVVWDVHRVSA